MPDNARRVDYYYATVPDKPGEGAKILGAFKKAGVNFLAFHAFPSGGKAQIDLVPVDAAKFLEAATKAGVSLSSKKTAFLVDGDDRVGVCADILERLGSAGINVTAMDAVAAGGGRYGALLWVKAGDVDKAAKALGAK